MWGTTEVTLRTYHYAEDAESLKLLLERNVLLEKTQGSLIATPLFLTRERRGNILLGYKRLSKIISKTQRDAMNDVCENLVKLGWGVPDEEKDPEKFCVMDDKILLRDLSCLLPNEDPPDVKCVSSEEMSTSSQNPDTKQLPLPKRAKQDSSADSEGKM